ncbi:DUF5707 domain-containing protein [Streptomyces sp. NPDC087787]|uniref:DUF5707 domain-containing protein n=1 Tax=Streptomyces sp. NPDC087787 TaxID=3365803 RepID=UPI003815AFD8
MESSGVRSVKVLAWPQQSSFAERRPTAADLTATESAVCKPAGQDTVRCTYTARVTDADAKSSPRGTWHVAVLVTAKDGTTTLDTEAAGFTVRCPGRSPPSRWAIGTGVLGEGGVETSRHPVPVHPFGVY